MCPEEDPPRGPAGGPGAAAQEEVRYELDDGGKVASETDHGAAGEVGDGVGRGTCQAAKGYAEGQWRR